MIIPSGNVSLGIFSALDGDTHALFLFYIFSIE